MCVWQKGVGDVLFHGKNAGQHASRLRDESGEGRSGAAQQAQRGERSLLRPSCLLQVTKEFTGRFMDKKIIHLVIGRKLISY